MNLDGFRRDLPRLQGLDDTQALMYLHQRYAPDVPFEVLAKRFGVKAPEPPPANRGMLGAANDTAISFANQVAGGVGAMGNFVSPGNRVSQFIDEDIIKSGEAKQSDVVRAGRERFQLQMEQAQDWKDELKAVVGHAADQPLQFAAQALGALATIGLPMSATRHGALALKATEKGATRAAASVGVGLGAAMGGGDAAGTAYELVGQIDRDTLMRAPEAAELAARGLDEAAIRHELGTRAARTAMPIPTLLGGGAGLLGAERILAGGKALRGGRASRSAQTGAVEFGTEAIEEGATTYEGRRAASAYDQSIDPWKGTPGAGAMGGILGGVSGAAMGAISPARQPDPPPPGQPPAPTLAIGNTPDPYIGFPDGTVGKRADVEAFVARLPEGQRAEARARLMGLGPQPSAADILPGQPAPLDRVPAILGAESLDDALIAAKAAIEAPLAPRRKTDATPVDLLGGAASVEAFIARLRDTNTPAARYFLGDIEAGRVTSDDIMGLLVPRAEVEPSVDQRLAAAAAQAPQPLLSTDLVTVDGQPYGTKSGASMRARREGIGAVTPVAGGWVVRTEESHESVDDVAVAADNLAGSHAGAGDLGGGSSGVVGRVVDGAGPALRDPAPSVAGAAAVEVEPDGDGAGSALSRVIGKIGRTPTTADELTMQENPDGTLTPMRGGYEVVDFDSGEPIALAGDVSAAQVIEAIRTAGALSSKDKFYSTDATAQAQPLEPAMESPAAPEPAAVAPIVPGAQVAQSPTVKPKVFTTRSGAARSKRAQGNQHRIQKVKGGYILRLSTDKEMEASAQAGRRLAARSVDTAKDTLLAAIAKLGGLAMSERADTVGQGNRNVGGNMLFTKGGRSLDDMADEVLRDLGYVPQREVDRDGGTTWLRDAIRAEFDGHRVHHSEGATDWMEDARREAEARMDDTAADESLADFSPDELDAQGYTAASPETQALTEQILAEAQAIGPNTESLREDAAKAAEGATEDDYHARLQDIARQAIGQTHADAARSDPGTARAGAENRGQVAGEEGAAEGLGAEKSKSAADSFKAALASGAEALGMTPGAMAGSYVKTVSDDTAQGGLRVTASVRFIRDERRLGGQVSVAAVRVDPATGREVSAAPTDPRSVFGTVDEVLAMVKRATQGAGPWAAEQGLTLSAQSEQDLRAKTEADTAANKADTAEQKRLADKAKADAERGEFALTGSDRAADTGAAAGQGDLSGAAPSMPTAAQGDQAVLYANLDGKTVEQSVDVEGATVTRRRDAAKVLRALDERKAALESLHICLKGGA